MEKKGAAGSKQSGEQGLEQLLQSAVRQPRHVQTKDGGALLALCVHCVVVEAGFTVNADRRLGALPYSPAADWNGKFENEWVLEYTRKGYVSAFTVHCSLQTASGRMFVHAREHDNPSNMRYMGLTVGKYIPDVARAKRESWTATERSGNVDTAPRERLRWFTGIIHEQDTLRQSIIYEQDTLRQSLHELIIDPLLASAMPSQEASEEPGTLLYRIRQKLPALPEIGPDRKVLLVGVGLIAAGTALYLYGKRRQRSLPPGHT